MKYHKLCTVSNKTVFLHHLPQPSSCSPPSLYFSPATRLHPSLSPPSLQIAKLAGGFGPDRLDSLWSCCGLVASSSNDVCIRLPQLPSLSCLQHSAFSLHTTAPITRVSFACYVANCAASCIFHTAACP